MVETKLHRLYYSLIKNSIFFNAKMIICKKSNKQMRKYPNLQEYYGPFFPYGRKQHEQGIEWLSWCSQSSRHQIHLCKTGQTFPSKFIFNNSAIHCFQHLTSSHLWLSLCSRPKSQKQGCCSELQGICLKSFLHPKDLLSFKKLIQGVASVWLRAFGFMPELLCYPRWHQTLVPCLDHCRQNSSGYR